MERTALDLLLEIEECVKSRWRSADRTERVVMNLKARAIEDRRCKNTESTILLPSLLAILMRLNNKWYFIILRRLLQQ